MAAAVLVGVTACTGPAARTPSAATPTPTPPAPAAGAPGTLSPVRLSVAAGTDPGAAAGRSLSLPRGWTGAVWANVPGARVAAWSPDGRLAVSTGGRGDVVLLTPASGTRAPGAAILLRGLQDPQGLAFTVQGGRTVLIVGEGTRITAWDYSDGRVSNHRVLVAGLPDAGHGAKGVAAHGDAVFYSIGSSGNRVPSDRGVSPQRATVWRVGLDGHGNRIVASGVRNGFGLAIAPDGTLFTAVNQADEQPFPFPGDRFGQVVREYVNENPVDQVSRLTSGIDLGWPYCVPDTRHGVTEVPYVDDPEFNPGGKALDCSRLPPTMVGLPAHSAPLGLAFTRDTSLQQTLGDGALIALHGSWDRQPPRAPSVVYSAWDAARAALGASTPLVTGFQDADGSRWGRSVDAVPGPDGSVYVTDDLAGLVYRLTPGG
ncbi:sugar dehydrogenase [Microbacterium mangrovi]|uniref:Sugar dehydrogenase n=1 Tax=Microbacterium mangrovi TaxID=1348253 RepID=A0A0B2A8N4_9MICO|nr:sugar dehydrogenase [Microbacterium mangrovi]